MSTESKTKPITLEELQKQIASKEQVYEDMTKSLQDKKDDYVQYQAKCYTELQELTKAHTNFFMHCIQIRDKQLEQNKTTVADLQKQISDLRVTKKSMKNDD